MDRVAEKLGIERQEDWYLATSEDLRDLGADNLLHRYYNDSFSLALQSIYPEFEWCLFHFVSVPQNYWKAKDNQKKMFDWMADQLGIQVQQDWYSVSLEDIHLLGGQGLLTNYHSNSLFSALQYVYPDFEWIPWLTRVPRNYWKETKNQRAALDDIAERLGINKQEDWYGIASEDITDIAGHSLLTHYHNSSMFALLKTSFPEFQWNPLLCKVMPQNRLQQKREVLNHLAEEFGIQKQEDWYLLLQEKAELVGYSAGTLKLLKTAYPEFTWHRLKRQNSPKMMLSQVWHEGIDPTGALDA